MKGIRFFLEYKTPQDKRKGTVKNPGNHQDNVLAVYHEQGYFSQGEWMYECTGAIFFEPNSVTGSTAASWRYVRENCKRIPEKLAREIHPKLFEYLDS